MTWNGLKIPKFCGKSKKLAEILSPETLVFFMYEQRLQVIDPYSPYQPGSQSNPTFEPLSSPAEENPPNKRNISPTMTNCSLQSTFFWYWKESVSWDALNSDQMSSICIKVNKVEQTLRWRGTNRNMGCFCFSGMSNTSGVLVVCIIQKTMSQVFYKRVSCPRHSYHT